MATAIVVHFSNVVAIDLDTISLDSPMRDFGLDSLIAIELKNWISRTLKAAVQTFEIVKAADLRELVTIVTRRSSLVRAYQPSGTRESIQCEGNRSELQEVSSSLILSTAPTDLMPLPLPNLDDSLDLYYDSVRVFLSDDNDRITRSAIQEFQQHGGLGQTLQDRLSQREADLQTENWLSDLFNAPYWLKMRRPINPFQHFFGSHIEGRFQHGQAERAAVISAAAFRFKHYLQTAQLKPDHLNDQPLCMATLERIFNCSRQPHSSIDKMKRFPSLDYFVALRRGRFYKITLKHNPGSPSYSLLEETFHKILEKERDCAPSIATLTADDRNNWAKVNIRPCQSRSVDTDKKDS